MKLLRFLLIPVAVLCPILEALAQYDDGRIRRFTPGTVVDLESAILSRRLSIPVSSFRTVGENPKAKEQATSHLGTLQNAGIEPNQASLAKYLDGLFPGDEERAQIMTILSKLDSPGYFERMVASRELVTATVLPHDIIAGFLESGSEEVKYRLRSVLHQREGRDDAIFFSALTIIKQQKVKGLAEKLIRAATLCSNPYQENALQEAILASLNDDQISLMETALTHPEAIVRTTGIKALASSGEQNATRLITEMMSKEESDHVILSGAVALANLGSREAIRFLVNLLESPDLSSRSGAVLALQQWTKQNFGFLAYDPEEKRSTAVTKWKEWMVKESSSSKLAERISINGEAQSYLFGNTLLAYGYGNKVVELDPSGKTVLEIPAAGVWSAEKLENGNILVAEMAANKVVEYDNKGKEVWSYPTQNPLNAKALRNGNILVALHQQNKVVELNREKKVVWSVDTPGNCTDCHRLPNGNTLYSIREKVCEVTPDRRVVWEHAGNQIYGVQPLPSGNVLIAELSLGRVIEVTRSGKIIWEFREKNPSDAFRLPNGNTLITGAKRFIEVTPDKKIIWEQSGCQYGTARR